MNSDNSDPDKLPDLLLFSRFAAHAMAPVAAGCSIEAVSSRLGHTDIGIVRRVYAHVVPDDDEKLAKQAVRCLDEIGCT